MKKINRLYQSVIEIGAVVVRNDIEGLRLMTVEALQSTAFGESARCIWFGSDDHLQFEQISLRLLDLFPHSVSTPDLALGQEVRVRAGGPVMTVLKIDSKDLALCEWDGPRGLARCRPFPIRCLTGSMV